ncbi:hypothetical protein F511_35431 [Dorcoceras hygrometricum]|uniref:Macro domain-containing protein n=1 Tax=Dorcoceras hygrometricum TaxID=472368 RepID=A0A2Z7A5V1_9LAMI|nr:hypothetical protein F511_35431 [Dorcoceras hygrometricum]
MSSGRADGSRTVEFPISESFVLKILLGDITEWSVDGSTDAIVNPANEGMLGGGGADGAIHRAAGPELFKACYALPEVSPGIRCPTGEARITRGFRLPASHVIYTVGPIYGIDKNPQATLRNAYRNSLRIAKENGIQYIAFTAISCGVYGYPYDEAATVAISTVKDFTKDIKESTGRSVSKFWGYLIGNTSSSSIKEVHFVLYSDEIYDVWLNKANELLQK